MLPIQLPRLISRFELQKVIEQAKYTHKVEAQGFYFNQEHFQSLICFVSSHNDLSHVKLSKDLLSPEQVKKILQVTNSNLAKGIKLLDENEERFGNIYTDWHHYNMDKKDLCKLNKTTLSALEKFPSPPERIIDFGAGTGQETIALLQQGYPSVVAIDGDKEAIAILESRAQEFIEGGALETYTGPFLKYQPPVKADLFISSYTWPYRPHDEFNACWDKTIACVKPGGWIAGQFFGSPLKADPAMTYHTEEEIRQLLKTDFECITIHRESAESSVIYGGTSAPWGSLFHVVAQKNRSFPD
ncbi:class I SAM-dependent methyltransferase [Estrella lausannensis]|uniref:Methyltransferase n=1 Tax=Estrella lausannensis TaxID=483423 RepID=A0A0H5DR63_9BACT|nr:class I SAM-dependent methyltransferase [Estrella lausannensis]CRX39166.1 Methyltransferase [Estrella lausannensis]